jgi:hypothetical protein
MKHAARAAHSRAPLALSSGGLNVGNGAARSRSLRGAHRQEYNQNDHSDRDEGSIIGGWSFVFSDVLKKLGKNRATEPLIAGRPSLSSWCAEFVDAANRV